jgi:heptosyltransferase-2
MSEPKGELIVRLPNHLGDACMAVPALELLAERGFALRLAGRAWSIPLFEAYDWPVTQLQGSNLDHVETLRSIRPAAAQALLLTNSFSSALEFRLAGYRSTGYARGGRSWLLASAVAVDLRDHMVEYYYRLASTLISNAPPVSSALSLRVSAAARDRARALLDGAGISSGYCVLCPIAIGRHRGQVKAWSGFTRLGHELAQRGRTVVSMPGPGESEAVRAALPSALLLSEGDVATFAAVLAGSELVVANDSGSGHLAAAVGAPLVSVFGVTELDQTRPWGPSVRLVGRSNGWPSYADVIATVEAALAVAS